MNEESNNARGPDEIYCPSCGKPIKKEAVVCPYCGVQVKELKVSNDTNRMTPEEELSEGIRQLSGMKVFYWFVVIVISIYLVASIVLIAASSETITLEYGFGIVRYLLTAIFVFGIIVAFYIIPLVGIIKRKPFAVPFTRFILVITIFGFPIGTIIGATLWKRINHPLAKKYLHYGEK